MTTLTLDKSRKALAVLAWRKGMTRKPFASGTKMHALPGRVHVEVHKREFQQGKHLTIKQALSLKRR